MDTDDPDDGQYEVETQLIIAKNVGYIQETLYNELLDNLQNIEKQMAGLIGKVRQRWR